MSTRAALIRQATERLRAAGIEDAARDARYLSRWASGLDGAGLAVALGDTPPADELARYEDAIARREIRVPASHITGERQFWGRDFFVTSDVLDPRPETEVLIAEALHRGPFQRILDIGTGSGCILLTLLAEWPDSAGTGTDISEKALGIAHRNAARHNLDKRADFRLGEWQADAEGPYDLLISNPPYIAADEMRDLAPEVRLHEPHLALTPGGDGLDAYRAILPRAAGLVAPGGYVLLEIGPTQSETVAAIAAASGLNVLMIIPDLDQRPRAVLAQA